MLYFVGIGPGDPELLTVKAARLIKEADAIVFADTGMGSSAVTNIVGDLLDGKTVCPVSIPMKGNREDWIHAHQQAASQLIEMLKQYPTIVYPVLGDPSIYASSSYLMHLVEESHPCKVVPGITTMCLAAAELNIPLCEQGESITVQDRYTPDKELPSGNVVIMKSGKHLADLKNAAGDREAYAVRNLGMKEEWKGKLNDIPEDDYSYFTTVIVKDHPMK